MKMLLSISWRNIWRHPARSGALLGAIVAGLWAGILVSALSNGMMDQRFNNLIEESMTHVQVHHPEFLTEREPDMFIQQAGKIFEYLENQQKVSTFTARTVTGGMIQSPVTTTGVQIQGVRVDWEPQTTTFHENLTEGEYLDTDQRNALLMGRSLSEELNVGIGNRVVLTFQTVENELTSASFNIVGIYWTASSAFDESNVFVRSEDLAQLIAGEPVYHEIAIMVTNVEKSDSIAAAINEQFPQSNAETWYELSPELRYFADFGNSMTFYVMLVIMLALAFGILNTMLMAIFERMRELGMLLAVGMSKLRVFTMIMMESVILTFTGACVGMLFAYATVSWLSEKGIDLAAVGGESMREFGYDTMIYPIFNINDFVIIVILVAGTAILSAIYPALKALGLKPAEVVRE